MFQKRASKIYSPRAGVTRTRGPGGARLRRVKWAARSAGQQMPIVTIMARSDSAERTPRIRSASVVAAPPQNPAAPPAASIVLNVSHENDVDFDDAARALREPTDARPPAARGGRCPAQPCARCPRSHAASCRRGRRVAARPAGQPSGEAAQVAPRGLSRPRPARAAPRSSSARSPSPCSRERRQKSRSSSFPPPPPRPAARAGANNARQRAPRHRSLPPALLHARARRLVVGGVAAAAVAGAAHARGALAAAGGRARCRACSCAR